MALVRKEFKQNSFVGETNSLANKLIPLRFALQALSTRSSIYFVFLLRAEPNDMLDINAYIEALTKLEFINSAVDFSLIKNLKHFIL